MKNLIIKLMMVMSFVLVVGGCAQRLSEGFTAEQIARLNKYKGKKPKDLTASEQKEVYDTIFEFFTRGIDYDAVGKSGCHIGSVVMHSSINAAKAQGKPGLELKGTMYTKCEHFYNACVAEWPKKDQFVKTIVANRPTIEQGLANFAVDKIQSCYAKFDDIMNMFSKVKCDATNAQLDQAAKDVKLKVGNEQAFQECSDIFKASGMYK